MLYFGKRLYGKVLQCDASYVATWFFHLWFVPLIPLGSTIVLRPLGNNQLQTLPTPFNLRSAALAYLRGWSVFMVVHGFVRWISSSAPEDAYWGLAIMVVAVVFSLVSLFVLGRVSDDTRARLQTYAKVFGAPVDLALLVAPTAANFAQGLRQRLVEAGRHVAVNYRAHYDPATQWGAIALDPTTRDVDFLVTALCLARVESARSTGEARTALNDLHDRIWEKLRHVEPFGTFGAPHVTATPPT